jgi:hypothetical protein
LEKEVREELSRINKRVDHIEDVVEQIYLTVASKQNEAVP